MRSLGKEGPQAAPRAALRQQGCTSIVLHRACARATAATACKRPGSPFVDLAAALLAEALEGGAAGVDALVALARVSNLAALAHWVLCGSLAEALHAVFAAVGVLRRLDGQRRCTHGVGRGRRGPQSGGSRQVAEGAQDRGAGTRPCRYQIMQAFNTSGRVQRALNTQPTTSRRPCKAGSRWEGGKAAAPAGHRLQSPLPPRPPPGLLHAAVASGLRPAPLPRREAALEERSGARRRPIQPPASPARTCPAQKNAPWASSSAASARRARTRAIATSAPSVWELIGRGR